MFFEEQIDADKARLFIGEVRRDRRVDISKAKISILVEQDGLINVEAPNENIAENVIKWVVANAGQKVEVGQVFQGLVTSKSAFGDFIALTPDEEGLLHTSDISNDRCFFPGDLVKVEITKKDHKGRLLLKLSN